jgi:ATP/ADP translocase
VLLAFLAFFLLLSGYYMLRPVRDEMGVQAGVERLQWLFSGTFVFTLVAVPLFGLVVKRVPRPRLVPAVYGFVVLNLLAFAAAFTAGITLATAAAFFIWLTTFNLIVVSLFWSAVSDAFTTEQSHRLYGTSPPAARPARSPARPSRRCSRATWAAPTSSRSRPACSLRQRCVWCSCAVRTRPS